MYIVKFFIMECWFSFMRSVGIFGTDIATCYLSWK